VISKIVREMMAARGTGLSKILGSAGQTATQMEAGNRAQKLNVDTNNANLAQARNMATAQAEFETTNKEIAEQNTRLYGEKQDAYQKAVQDLLNQRNASSSYNNQGAMSKYTMEGQGNISSQMAAWQMQNQGLQNAADKQFAQQMAGYEAELANGSKGGAPTAPKVNTVYL
jgi:hypothetical protein